MVVVSTGPKLTPLPGNKEESISKKWSMAIKYGSLITLVAFNSCSVLCLRYSQIRIGDKFVTSSVVVMAELVKLTISLCLVCLDGNITDVFRTLVNQPLDSLKICLPALLYVMHNNLLYVGAQHLDATTFLITFRLKIPMTAIFSFFMLKQSFRVLQLLALALLVVGVVLVQLAQVTETTVVVVTQNRLLGFTAIASAAVLSSFSGIYLEKILKCTDTSIWMRNVQLSSISLVLALASCLVYNWTPIMDNGFFFGYDWFVVCLILMQAAGGLTVAVVIKYADSILKCFASSLSIAVASAASTFLFGLQISWMFAGGVAAVVSSTFLYNLRHCDAKVNNYVGIDR